MVTKQCALDDGQHFDWFLAHQCTKLITCVLVAGASEGDEL